MRSVSAFIMAVALVLSGTAGTASEFLDIRDHPTCPICGMDRGRYSHSRMLIDYREGATGTCSIHCAGADLAVNRHKTVQGLYAADYVGTQLIQADTAVWVIGGDRFGVMTLRAKWAFEKKADADAFVREHGGRVGTYEDAMKATFEDMYQDIQAVRKGTKERRKGGAR